MSTDVAWVCCHTGSDGQWRGPGSAVTRAVMDSGVARACCHTGSDEQGHGPRTCCHNDPLTQAHISLNRKCKLVTSGPWLEVAPIALGDVSIIPESTHADGRGHNIALWAVSDKGDVLCRLGVSELNPAVSTSLLDIRIPS